MGSFSDKLSKLIISRKIKVDEVVFGAEISRNAFFKYKNGTRLPANIDIVKRIADTLCLDYVEYDSLIEAYLLDSVGEYKFRGMRAVEKFLLTPVEIMYRSDTPLPMRDIKPADNLTTVHGKIQVMMQIFSMIREGVSKGDVFIFETVLERDIFSVIQQANTGVEGERGSIEHIIAVDETDGSDMSDRLYGIESLEKIIITMSRCEKYMPYYFYASLSTLRVMENLFNNFVVLADSVFCYSGNMEYGVFYRDPAICRMYMDIIQNRREHAEPFVEKTDFLKGFRIFEHFFQNTDDCYIFNPGMCIAAIVKKDDTFLESNARHDIPGVTDVIKEFAKYADSYQNSVPINKDRRHHITPKTMICYNMREGYFGEFPRELTIPLGKEQMRELLRRFRSFSQRNDIRLLNDERFPESNTIEVIAAPQNALISIILPNEMNIRFFQVREVGTVGLIYEYLKHLYNDEGETGRERSVWFEEMLEK